MSQGYKRKSTIYKLVFDDSDMAGLEVMAKSVPTGRLLKLMKLADVAGQGVQKKQLTAEDVAAIESLFEGFAKALISWNLVDDDDAPVPANLEGVHDQDFEFVLTIIMQWIEAIAGTSTNLGKASSDGPLSLVGSLPMVTQ